MTEGHHRQAPAIAKPTAEVCTGEGRGVYWGGARCVLGRGEPRAYDEDAGHRSPKFRGELTRCAPTVASARPVSDSTAEHAAPASPDRRSPIVSDGRTDTASRHAPGSAAQGLATGSAPARRQTVSAIATASLIACTPSRVTSSPSHLADPPPLHRAMGQPSASRFR
jgi:hypothetical protein